MTQQRVIDQVDWIARAAVVRPPEGLFIGGEARSAADGLTRPVHASRDGAVLTRLAWAGERDADLAVAAARAAFDRGPWPRLHPRQRGEVLQRLATLVEAHRAEIALLISLEMGKPIRHSYEIELRALIGSLRFYGELRTRRRGRFRRRPRASLHW